MTTNRLGELEAFARQHAEMLPPEMPVELLQRQSREFHDERERHREEVIASLKASADWTIEEAGDLANRGDDDGRERWQHLCWHIWFDLQWRAKPVEEKALEAATDALIETGECQVPFVFKWERYPPDALLMAVDVVDMLAARMRKEQRPIVPDPQAAKDLLRSLALSLDPENAS